ncbi:hypothetical protein PPERSA_04905 [Pseudocohnilembus persalinus]|uniref:EF-hand domain-containing protein n=1 Tax=Pseudocohnilembus persalinus TaxID=266149 RepID=A0A0V0QJD8_PSEPJ|nr:hypothetical protein PPERSA_04905 [Pseudocohnilembus persalinus]|eukprot:KRX02283.1 hypothetical protein PPERSA_04905 [Pseudocohnilembus persalinus]
MRLQNEQSREGYVDVFETIALMCLINNDDYERRVDYIFRLFDFDFSNNLDMNEFILTIQTVMKGLCKIVDLNPPSLQDMEHFADRFFSSADENQDGQISMNEFVQFVKQNWELQDWFLKFADIQTYENALRRHQEKEQFMIQQFLGFKNIKENDIYVKIKSNVDVFFPILKRQLKDMSYQDFELLTKYLILVSNALYKDQEEDFINYQGYKSVINAWSAFDGCDINYDNSIDKNEIEFLIASMENYKPSKERIQQELKNIDADNSGNISREEWIKYNCLDKFSSAKALTIFYLNKHAH